MSIVQTIGIAVFLTLLSLPIFRRYAGRLSLMDRPNGRSMHIRPVPRGAGIAFVGSALVGLIFSGYSEFPGFRWIAGALLVILAIGVLDDRHEASPRMKFLIIFFATILIWEGGLRIDHVGNYLGIDLSLEWLALPFTYLAVAGFTNAMNLIDGLDGLAGSVSMVILSFFLLLGWRHHDPFLEGFSSVFMATIAIFLFFNWYPAKIFMGDSGSLSLGFLISILAIYSLRYVPSAAILFVGAYPIVDTLAAMIRRKRNGYYATRPDRCHLHHLLLHRLGSVPKTVAAIVAFQIGGVLIAWVIPREVDQAPVLCAFGGVVWLVYGWVQHEIKREGLSC